MTFCYFFHGCRLSYSNRGGQVTNAWDIQSELENVVLATALTTLWEALEAQPLTAWVLTPAPPLAGDVSGHFLLSQFISFSFSR